MGLVNCHTLGFGFFRVFFSFLKVVSLEWCVSMPLDHRWKKEIYRELAGHTTECCTMNTSVDGPSSEAEKLRRTSFNSSAARGPFLLFISSAKLVLMVWHILHKTWFCWFCFLLRTYGIYYAHILPLSSDLESKWRRDFDYFKDKS